MHGGCTVWCGPHAILGLKNDLAFMAVEKGVPTVPQPIRTDWPLSRE